MSKFEKRAYDGEQTYTKVANDPEDYTGKRQCKRKFTVLFKGYKPELPKPYDTLVSKSFYEMVIEGGEKRLPIIFSPRRGLEDRIKELSKDSMVTVYGDVRQKTLRGSIKDKKKNGQKLFYFFYLNDVEEFKGYEEDFSKFNASKFQPVKFMRLDIQRAKFLDKQIKFDVHFKGISNSIKPAISKYGGIDSSEHFVLIPSEGLSIPIIINRDNEYCVGPIVNAKKNGTLSLCGVLRSVSNPQDMDTSDDGKKKPDLGHLYIYLQGIVEVVE